MGRFPCVSWRREATLAPRSPAGSSAARLGGTAHCSPTCGRSLAGALARPLPGRAAIPPAAASLTHQMIW